MDECTQKTDLTNSIAANARGPAKASGDGGSAEQFPLSDQIAADQYLAAKKAVRRRGFPIKVIKLIPGSAND